MTIPIDSTDAREQRELDAERRDAEQAERRRHADQCRGGWLGEDDDGRPIPCARCRPHLLAVPCRTCQVNPTRCAGEYARGRGRCCPDCSHAPLQRAAVR